MAFKPIPSTLTPEEKTRFNWDSQDRSNNIDAAGVMDSRTSGRVLGVSWQVWDESIGKRQQDINEELYDLAYAGL